MNTGNTYNTVTNIAMTGIKKYIYDIVTVVILVAILAASLHIFGITDFSNKESLSVFLMDWLPFFIAAILLNANLYQKGIFVGKSQTVYTKVLNVYNTHVNAFTGKDLDVLPEFCEYYNNKALTSLQRSILKVESISLERFEDGTENEKALRLLTKKELIDKYGKSIAKVVIKAKRVKIKSICVNGLLSHNNVKDPTDLGKSEKSMTTAANIKSTIKYLMSTALMSIIVVNDLSTWGWLNLFVLLFKISFLLAKTIMAYYKGYNNTTVDLVAHIARKVDIFKEFEAWKDIRELN